MTKGYGQYCPIARTLDLLGDKWTLLIVRELLRGKHRFKDIEAGLRGIPPNLLSYRLKALEAAGLVSRQYFRELPPRVEYTLTPEGQSLEVLLDEIATWGALHLMQGDVQCEEVDLDLYFFHLPRFFCSDKARGLDATIAIELSGAGGGEWFVHLAGGHCEVNKEPAAAAATIRCTVEDWVRFMATHRDPEGLATCQSVTFEGDQNLGRRFGHFFCREIAFEPVSVSSGEACCG